MLWPLFPVLSSNSVTKSFISDFRVTMSYLARHRGRSGHLSLCVLSSDRLFAYFAFCIFVFCIFAYFWTFFTTCFVVRSSLCIFCAFMLLISVWNFRWRIDEKEFPEMTFLTEAIFCYRGIRVNFIREHFVFVVCLCKLQAADFLIVHSAFASCCHICSPVWGQVVKSWGQLSFWLRPVLSRAKIKLLVVVVVVVAMVRVKSLYRVACPDQWVDPLLTCQITLQSLQLTTSINSLVLGVFVFLFVFVFLRPP